MSGAATRATATTRAAAGRTPAADDRFRVTPAELYSRALLSGAGSGALRVRRADGTTSPVPVHTWLAAPTAADERLLRRVEGPVLDVGCGPGRHVAALARRGVVALGIDVCGAAVFTSRERGGRAVQGCVFAPVPHAGRWRTLLLLDGNIGIGGCPEGLLRRCAELTDRDGRIVVELGAPGTPTAQVRLRLEDDATASDWFPWAQVSADGIEALARCARLRVTDSFVEGSRWFAILATR